MKSATTEDHTLRFKKHLKDHYQLSENEWKLIEHYVQCESLKKNEYFVQNGKVCRLMGFIAEGVMRFCMYRENGEEITCFFASEGNFAGDPESFITHKPSDKNMHALTDCTLMCMSYEHMQKILIVLPRFKEIMAGIDRNVMLGLLGQRELFYNLDAAAKYQKFMENYPHILQRVPLGYVASFLGITQQSLSRLRKEIS